MRFLIGKKVEMTQRFLENGTVAPVTLVAVDQCTVTQVRSQEKDGYAAVQVGYGKKRNLAKPQIGHTKALGKTFASFREFRVSDSAGIELGKVVDISTFAPGDMVDVIGVSKGRGFQGVVKRHGFSGSPATHGHKDQLRMPGSIGSRAQGPVQPGKRMPGRMGGGQITVKNLEVVDVDSEQGVVALRGAVPGARGSELAIFARSGDLQFVSEEKKEQEEKKEESPVEENPVVEEKATEEKPAPVEEPASVKEDKPTEDKKEEKAETPSK